LGQFSKPSAHAQFLRRAEQNLAALCQFESALLMQKEAERVEKIETAKARERAVAAMRIDYDNLIVQQQKEIDAMREYRKRQTILLEKERDTEIEPLEMIAVRLEEQMNSKPMNERKKNLKLTESKSLTPGRPLGMASEVRKPPELLPVGGIQLRQFIRVRKAEEKASPKKKKKKSLF
jgi:hypothetical protein